MKKRIWHKVISIALVLCLVITLIPDIGYATDSSESDQTTVTFESESTKSEEETPQDEGLTVSDENQEDESLLEPEGAGEPDVVETAIEPEEPDEEALEAANNPAMEGFTEEQVIEKTETTTTYDIGDGLNAKVFHGGEVRFENEEGELIDYDPSLVKIKDGEKSDEDTSLKGYEYRNNTGDKKQYLPEKLSEKTPVIMEYGGNQITITPTDDTVRTLGLYQSEVKVGNEIVPTIYEGEGESVPVNAVYGDENDSAVLTYTSGDAGIKETLTLNELPETNIFTYEIYAGDLIVKENTLDEGITFIDPETDDIIAGIDAPWMNDATGEAYSTDITYDLEKVAYEDGLYILTMTIGEEYLSDEKREFPVTVDPTVTWKGNDKIRDTYIITGSGYAGTNFYDTSNTKMPVGTNSTGKHRSLFKILNLKSEIEGMSVESAILTLYESSSSASGQTIRANRLIEDWTPSTVTWNNQPEWNTAAYTAQVTTSGTKNTAKTFDCTAFAKNVSNGTSNYGLILRNMTTDPSYSCFWGSRYATTAYRPKLVVTYHEKPTAPSSVNVHRSSSASSSGYINTSYFGEGRGVYASWEGIESYDLASVQYRFTAYDSSTAEPTSIGESEVDLTTYRSIGTTAASASYVYASYSKYLPEGKYKLYIRGKDSAGNVGPAKYKVVTYDWTAPVITDASLFDDSPPDIYTGDTVPEIDCCISETNLSEVKISVDGGAEVTVNDIENWDDGYHRYKVPEGLITESGKHTVKLIVYDKAGNNSSVSFDHYVDVEKPEITEFSIDTETSPLQPTGNQTPTVSWSIDEPQLKEVAIYVDEACEEVSYKNTGTFQFPSAVFPDNGNYPIDLKVTDMGGNVAWARIIYYVDVFGPIIESLSIEPETNIINKSANRSPVISWGVRDSYVPGTEYDASNFESLNEVIIYYSFDKTNWIEISKSEVGTFAIPSSAWPEEEGTFNIYFKAVDEAGNESQQSLTYHLKDGNNYAPVDLAAEEYYGKRVLTWNFDAFNEDKYRYDIHRGTDADFTPSEQNRIEENYDVRYRLYIDNDVLAADTYYYKIVAKPKTSATGQQQISDAAEFTNTITASDLDNTVGYKPYLSYTSVELPIGTAQIEASSGNLMYQQDDFNVSNVQLDYSMSRTYNSRTGITSMTGKGWMDSYHKELYQSGNDVYFMDSDGSCYFFDYVNGNYVCEETREYTLTQAAGEYIIKDKEQTEYIFNRFGQLLETSEPNGIAITNVYDSKGRLSAVKSGTKDYSGNTANTLLDFYYSGESLLLDRIWDLENTKFEYVYSGDDLLDRVEVSGAQNNNYQYQETFRYGYDNDGNLNTIYDGEDEMYSFTFDSDKVEKAVYPDNEYLQFTYNNQNTLVEKFNAAGTKVLEETTAFDSSTGKVISHIDPFGTVTYSYMENQPYFVKTETVSAGYQILSDDGTVTLKNDSNTVTYEYTDSDTMNVETETESDGTVTEYTYDDTNNVVTEIVREGSDKISELYYWYDDNGNLECTYDTVEEIKSVSEFNQEGNETKVTESDNVEISSDITSDLEEIDYQEVLEEGVSVSETTSDYDSCGNEIKSETVMSDITEKTSRKYDKMGREVFSLQNGVRTFTTYDFLGRAVKVETREKINNETITITTEYRYDGNGSLIVEEVSGGMRKAYSYDSRNRVTNESVTGDGIESRSKTTSYGYQSQISVKDGISSRNEDICYVETVKDTAKNTVSTKYIDTAGNTVKEIAGWTYSDYTYDKSGNCIATITGDVGSSEYYKEIALYDKDGNNFANISNPSVSNGKYAVSSNSILTKMSYDPEGNMTSSTDGLGIVTAYDYDDQSRLEAVDITGGNVDLTVTYHETETNGNVTTETTDANGNKKTETVNAAGLTVATSDIDTASIDTDSNNSITVEYVYDTVGRKIKDKFADDSYIEYEYIEDSESDRLQKRTAYKNTGQKESTVEYLYDNRGRLSKIICKDSSNTQYSLTEYTYDCEDKILSESITYANGGVNTIEYSYDSEGRLKSRKYPSDTGLGTINYEYDGIGRCTKILKGSSAIREYTYDGFGRLSVIKEYDKPGSSSFVRTEYHYDDFGRVSDMLTFDGNSSTNTLESNGYVYDKNDRIIKYTHINNLPESVINETRDYTYDTHGNLIKSVKKNNSDGSILTTAYSYDNVGNRITMNEGGVNTSYTYNGLNQLKTQTSPAGTVNYSYDARGNCISETGGGESIAMEYAVTGEMTKLIKGSVTQTNVYNQNGQRISRTQNGTTRSYYYDQGTSAYTEDGTNIISANLLSPENAIVGSYCGNTYYNYLTDIQGSTTNIIKEDGTLAAAYDYTDFGETTEITDSSFDNQICYTGGIYDKETGLYYLNARYYDPEIGRFISQDSYRGELDDPGQWHLYAYCANNPINYVDPSGHASLKNKKIYIDPGHGGEDNGAVRTYFGVTYKEKNLNLKLANKVYKKLVAEGATVYRSRSTDKTVSLTQRWTDANNKKVSIFVSVHHNASRVVAMKGAKVLYAGKHHKNKSKALAKSINNQIKNLEIFTNLGVKKRTDLAVLNGTKMPAVLTETGYMSHYNDLMKAINNRDAIASAIVRGIKGYY